MPNLFGVKRFIQEVRDLVRFVSNLGEQFEILRETRSQYELFLGVCMDWKEESCRRNTAHFCFSPVIDFCLVQL